MLFFIKYTLVTFVSIFIGSFSAANIVFPLLYGKNETAAESGNKKGINIIPPIVWCGIVYMTYEGLSKYLPDYLLLAIIVYAVSFVGTLIKGYKAYK
jgi:hypothetical protein